MKTQRKLMASVIAAFLATLHTTFVVYFLPQYYVDGTIDNNQINTKMAYVIASAYFLNMR